MEKIVKNKLKDTKNDMKKLKESKMNCILKLSDYKRNTPLYEHCKKDIEWLKEDIQSTQVRLNILNELLREYEIKMS